MIYRNFEYDLYKSAKGWIGVIRRVPRVRRLTDVYMGPYKTYDKAIAAIKREIRRVLDGKEEL
jgi:hypothetical protein